MAKGSVLVVDDEPQIRSILESSLTASGYVVTVAANGDEALKALKREKIDLIVTDLLMPEKDGTEVIAEARKKYPHVRVVAMSGGGHIPQEEYLKIARGFGAHALLAKPFELHQLLGAVEKLLPPSAV